MAIVRKRYCNDAGFTAEFNRVREFLIRINRDKVVDEGFLWGRWEWMFCLRIILDTANLSCIGLWEDDGEIVALATYEQSIGYAWLLMDPNYNYLKEEMLQYAQSYMKKEGSIKVLIDDTDQELQDIAALEGFRPTQEREANAEIPIKDYNIHYTLPDGYRIVSMAEEFDLKKYHRVLWRGFNHEGEPDESQVALEERREQLSGPHVNLHIKIAVADPDGNFVSYCGMWYEEGTDYALVEPVATDPEYRMLGLGKAAVLEGVKRCGQLGAQKAYVGSSQQFYYNIGFRPCSNKTWWEKKSL
jgi:GNAT superfamily N-acetyltransferase